MADEKELYPSRGYFDVTGVVTISEKTFQKDLKSKQNPDYTYSRIDLQLKTDDGDTFFLNTMDGFDSKKGKTLYARDKDGNNFKVNFADRKNKTILDQLDEKSFVGVALTHEDANDNGYRPWKYESFLAFYDAIDYLSTRLETGMKLRITGQTRYSEYNGDTQKNFNVNNIYLLDEQDEYETKFTFRQNVLIQHGDIDLSKWEDEGTATVNSHVLNKKSGNLELLSLPLTIRTTDKNKQPYKKVIDKFLDVPEGIVRRINLEGSYHRGYVASQVTTDDLPDEAKELIEDGLYTEKEVTRMYANRESVDEMTIIRPVMFKRRDAQAPSVDFSDDEVTVEDIEKLNVEVPWDEDGNAKEDELDESPDEKDDLSFLDDLG